MAYTTTTRASGAFTATPTSGIAGMVAAFREARARHRVYRTTRDELGALSDRDLADLGIGRSDVDRIARDAAASTKVR